MRLIKVSRPVSWVNTAYPFAAGYLILGGQIDVLLIVGSVFFLIPYNLLMYGINDVFDYESDIANPRKGGIEGAVEAKTFHPVILSTSIGLSLPFVIALMILSSIQTALVLLGVLFFVVAYSAKYLRFKEIPVLDSVTSSSHFVGPLVFAAACVGFPPAVWPFVAAFFLWGIASHAFGAVQDIIPDRKGKLSSIATYLGARKTVYFSLFSYSAAVILLFVSGPRAFVVACFGLLYVFNLIPFLNVTDKTSPYTNQGWKRFIWINYLVGAAVTITLMLNFI